MTKDIPFSQAQFVTSAVKAEQFPSLMTSEGKPMPEIAIVGRSNVGKSSLINSLLNNKKLAKVSSTPGKTQMLNFFTIDHRLGLVDLPGYGFAKVTPDIKKNWSIVIDTYLQTRPSLKLILFLIDSRRTPETEDLTFMQWIAFHHKPLLIIFTKTDKLSEHEKQKNTLFSLATLKSFLDNAPPQFLHYSIKQPKARIALVRQINKIIKESWD